MVLHHHFVNARDNTPCGLFGSGNTLISSFYPTCVFPLVPVVIVIAFYILAECFEGGHVEKIMVGHIHRLCIGGVSFPHAVFADLSNQLIEDILAALGDAVKCFEIGVRARGFPQMRILWVLQLRDIFLVLVIIGRLPNLHYQLISSPPPQGRLKFARAL